MPRQRPRWRRWREVERESYPSPFLLKQLCGDSTLVGRLQRAFRYSETALICPIGRVPRAIRRNPMKLSLSYLLVLSSIFTCASSLAAQDRTTTDGQTFTHGAGTSS